MIYSMPPTEPASDAALLPPPTGMLVSMAIISARMSITGCVVLVSSQRSGNGHSYLGHGLIVDVDKLLGVGVDLQRAVEA